MSPVTVDDLVRLADHLGLAPSALFSALYEFAQSAHGATFEVRGRSGQVYACTRRA